MSNTSGFVAKSISISLVVMTRLVSLLMLVFPCKLHGMKVRGTGRKRSPGNSIAMSEKDKVQDSEGRNVRHTSGMP